VKDVTGVIGIECTGKTFKGLDSGLRQVTWEMGRKQGKKCFGGKG